MSLAIGALPSLRNSSRSRPRFHAAQSGSITLDQLAPAASLIAPPIRCGRTNTKLPLRKGSNEKRALDQIQRPAVSQALTRRQLASTPRSSFVCPNTDLDLLLIEDSLAYVLMLTQQTS